MIHNNHKRQGRHQNMPGGHNLEKNTGYEKIIEVILDKINNLANKNINDRQSKNDPDPLVSDFDQIHN